MPAPCLQIVSEAVRSLNLQPRSGEELERITDAALAHVDQMPPEDTESLEPDDTLQLHRVAAAAGFFRPPPQETVMGQDRDELIQNAVKAVLQAPVLLDLAEALPEWDLAYGALGMDLPDFLRSRECSAALRKELRDGCLLELNRGTFVRLPAPEECQAGDLTTAMKEGDGRTVAAIVVARLVRDQERAPVDLMRQTIADGYAGSVANAEDFVLRAVGAVPRQVVKVLNKPTIDIIASGYLRLERSRMVLVNAAFSPENSGCLDFQIALKRLGHHFGIDQWKECSWQSASNVTANVATAAPAPVTEVQEVVPETLQAAGNQVGQPFLSFKELVLFSCDRRAKQFYLIPGNG